jgi:hypothetical protein
MNEGAVITRGGTTTSGAAQRWGVAIMIGGSSAVRGVPS